MMKVLVQMNKYFGQNGCDDCLLKRINTIELVQMISLNSLTMYQTLKTIHSFRLDSGHDKQFKWI